MRGISKSRLALIAVIIVLVTAALVTVSGVASAATKVTGAGDVHCTATGKLKTNKKLTTTPVKVKLNIKAALTCTQGQTGTNGVTVTSGKLSASIGPSTASCTTTNFGTGKGKVVWKASGGSVVSSAIAFTAANTTDGNNVVMDIVGAPGAKSSYIGADAKLHLVGDTLSGGLCAGAAKGFAFTGAGGPSTFDIAIPNPLNLPIQHVVILMQENRSADSHFGALNSQGQPDFEAEPATPGNPDPTNPSGPPILPFHKTNFCDVADLDHSWNGTHHEIDGGAMDGFTAANAVTADPTGHRAMGYYDQTDLPFYYKLYSTFATGDRYFASAPTQTFPNRLYLYAATSFGHIRNDVIGTTQKSIFELLDSRSIPWKIYSSGSQSYGSLFFQYVTNRRAQHVFPISQYFTDLNNNALPSVTFIDPGIDDNPQTENDEHPPADVQLGQKYVADAVNALIASPEWATSAFFLTYDEHGGFYDHVAPPAAIPPDNIPPKLLPGDQPGAFDIYGVRVPEVTISPYAKPASVTHVVHDHTSITRFVEERFGLPNLTNRDLNADPMLQMFDFSTPALLHPPAMPAAPIDAGQLATCEVAP